MSYSAVLMTRLRGWTGNCPCPHGCRACLTGPGQMNDIAWGLEQMNHPDYEMFCAVALDYALDNYEKSQEKVLLDWVDNACELLYRNQLNVRLPCIARSDYKQPAPKTPL